MSNLEDARHSITIKWNGGHNATWHNVSGASVEDTRLQLVQAYGLDDSLTFPEAVIEATATAQGLWNAHEGLGARPSARGGARPSSTPSGASQGTPAASAPAADAEKSPSEAMIERLGTFTTKKEVQEFLREHQAKAAKSSEYLDLAKHPEVLAVAKKQINDLP